MIPLAERFRPQSFDEYVGQDHLISEGKFLRKAIENDLIPSMILWGPPGSGKTSLAKIIANTAKKPFFKFSAVLQGVKDIRDIVKEAELSIKNNSLNTILFIDEIHRFNKAQQDALLPHVEAGTIILIGATTENPSFEIINALLSRCQVFVLKTLEDDDILKVLKRALESSNGLKSLNPKIDEESLKYLVRISEGDLRIALNALESTLLNTKEENGFRKIDISNINEAVSKRIFYDKKGEEFYNLISALHKSMRGSDTQAALYWLFRMLEGGADPLYIARRLVRFASEDVGLSDPNALTQAIATKEAVHFLGLPECNTALAQCVIYLSTSPKSNSIYVAANNAKEVVKNKKAYPVPMSIRNAPTSLMKDIGYGKDYKYDHNFKNKFSGQDFLPDELKDEVFYSPGEFGFEKEIKKRINYWKSLKP